ncbi:MULTISPECIES: SpaA isopeptide-forming pilin-related protein [Clostridia]|uniref:SpaA isopeptide-forming pilin-related protein n=1 Tax=Clostridia TaxID=186801 RepID=UPI001411FF0A|nr:MULTISPECIES: SpaA isopeptide-forming pilin-related protein [Clostridia]
MKKQLSVLFIIFLLMQTISSSLAFPMQVKAQDLSKDEIVKNMELLNESGESIQQEDKQKATHVKVDWSIKGITVEPDKDYTQQLPANIKMDKKQAGKLWVEEAEVGTYIVNTDSTLTIRFNEGISQFPEASGSFTAEIVPRAEEKEQEEKADETTPEQNETTSEQKDVGSTDDAEEIAEDRKEEVNHTENANSEEKALKSAEGEQLEKVAQKTEEMDPLKAIKENILTRAEVIYENSEGEPIDKPGLGSIIAIKYWWELPNGHNYKEGDTFTFQVPPELDIYNQIDRLEMKFNGETIGYLSVTKDGTATIEFTKFIEGYSNINGNFEILTQLSEEIIINEEKEVIITPIEGKDSITIPIDFNPAGPAVEKQGIPNRSYNAEEIEWTVDFNKTLDTIRNATINDPIQKGQALKEGSIKLYHLETKLSGEVSQGQEVDPNSYTVGKTEDGEDFTVHFSEDIHSAFRLVYETDITDADQAVFKNNVTLTGEGTQDKTAEATVTVGRGKPLKKKATDYDRANQMITWEIRYNYNEKNIAKEDALLKDFFNRSQDLIEDSFVVKKITLDENGHEVGEGEVVTNYTIDPKQQGDQNGFHLQFTEDISSAYKIVYKTKASERVFDEQEITNKVDAGDHSATGKENIGQVILFKNHGKPNYKDKTMEWTITFNHDKHKMNHVVLKDTFTNKGLTLLPETIKISGMEKGTDYELVKNEADEFVIEFKKTITEPHTISYMTEFDYDQREDKDKHFINHAHLTWTDEDGNDREKETDATFTPDEFTQHNGFKHGSYNAVTKEITWNIGVNYNLKKLENASVEDYIQGNQQLIRDSITVYLMELTGEENGTKLREAIPGEDYSTKFIKNEQGDPGFQINFEKEIHEPYVIEYKTSLENLDLVAANYNNTATLYNGDQKETDLDASVSIPHGGKYTTKSGSQNGKAIDWQVHINFAQSQVSNATIVDNPSNNQALLEGSFRLYATSIDEAGEVSKGELLELNKDYTLDLKQNPDTFTLKFKEEINEPYILEYQSLILAKPGETVNNEISFSGENIKEVVNESQSSVSVKRTAGMGEGKGEIGRLTVYKTDRNSGNPLSEATFTLKDPESGITIGTKTTNEDGKIVFDRLLYGTYTLIEDSAPDGYLIDKKQYDITIDKPYEENSEEKIGNQVTVTNSKIIRDVQLQKMDQETGDILAGATFVLEKKAGDSYKVVDYLTTDVAGMIYKANLEPGKYRFVETKSPNGYQLNTEPIPFTISEKQTEILTLTAENIKLGSAELTKLAKEGENQVLKDAEFRLEREDGTVVYPLLRTDESGKILVPNLEPGKYQFIETKAPAYYQLNEEPIPFTVQYGDSSTVMVTAINELILGKAELTKVDKDNKALKLEGAKFELQDEAGNILQEDLTTNKDGKIVVEDLKPGKYQFVETKAPAHYQLDETPISFTIDKSKTEADVEVISVQATNKLIPGSVELEKVDEDNQDKKLAGAVFELQDADGKVLQEGLTTNTEGKIVVEDLRPGKYQFVETQAPDYYKLGTEPIIFEIEKSQKEIGSVTATNKLLTGKVELTKIDKDNKKQFLEGAVFELQNEAGKMLQKGLTTNKDGKIVVEDLKPGKYQFVETKAPAHYQLDETPIPFTIDKSKTEADVEVVSVQAMNKLIPGSVELEKVDEDNQDKKLAGAVFELQDADGKVLQEGLTTNTEGKIVVEDLRPGKYQFVETQAPAYYQTDNKPITFEIEKSQKEIGSVTATNKLLTGKVELTKVDKDNDNAPLAEAEFMLQDETGKMLQKGLTTNKDGKIVVENLKPGKYQFVETQAPKGYQLDETPIPFTIDKSKTEADVEVVSVQATNELIRGAVELVKVDEDNQDKTLAGAVFELQDEAGKTLQEGLTTNKDGKIVVEDLKPGKYQFVETQAPKGYQLNETPKPFMIDFSQEKTLELIVGNSIIQKAPVTDSGNDDSQPTQKDPENSKEQSDQTGQQAGEKLPQTGEEWLRYMMILGISLFILGGLLLISRRRKAN